MMLSCCSKIGFIYASNIDTFAVTLDDYLSSLEADNEFSGTVCVTKCGNRIFNEAYGYRDIENHFLNDTNTIFRIGSITKTFTAVLIMQLVEEGFLSFDDLLSDYYSIIPNAPEITIDMMLHHQSGIYDFTTHPDYLGYFEQPKTRQEMLDIVMYHSSVFEPGTDTGYSNTNYLLLGYIIEDITGKSYNTNVQERISDVIGLTNTLCASTINTDNNKSESFRLEDGEWILAPETHISIPHGAGAVVSTSSELTSFISALFNFELVNSTSLHNMLTQYGGYGMGIIRVSYQNKVVYGHNGVINGFSGTMIYIPEDEIALVFLSNGLDYSQQDLWTEILDIYYGCLSKALHEIEMGQPEQFPFHPPEWMTGTYAHISLFKNTRNIYYLSLDTWDTKPQY